VAEILGLGLPQPDTMSITLINDHNPRGAVNFHFSGAGKRAALHAWTHRFNASSTLTDSMTPSGHAYTTIKFTNSGVTFTCFA
jgi:hypothetical protein